MSLVQQKTYVSPRTTTSASCTVCNGGARRTSLSMSSSAVTGKLSHGEFNFRVLVSHMENNGLCACGSLSLVYSTIYLHLALRFCETKTQLQSLIVSVSQLLLLASLPLEFVRFSVSALFSRHSVFLYVSSSVSSEMILSDNRIRKTSIKHLIIFCRSHQ